jgi:hypothetical protein
MSTSFITPGHIRAFQAVTTGLRPRALMDPSVTMQTVWSG